MRREVWREERSSEGEEQEKASDSEGTSVSTDEREVSPETAPGHDLPAIRRRKTGRKTGLGPDKHEFLRHYP